jgi:hypothetical protein
MYTIYTFYNIVYTCNQTINSQEALFQNLNEKLIELMIVIIKIPTNDYQYTKKKQFLIKIISTVDLVSNTFSIGTCNLEKKQFLNNSTMIIC